MDLQNKPKHIINGTKIQIRINVFSQEAYVLRYGKKRPIKMIHNRKRKMSKIADNQKDLQVILDQFRRDN